MSGKRHFLTIGLTPHRLEFLPATQALMAQHQSIVLEEPPHPDLKAFLSGKLPVETFIDEIEAGFPQYSKASYQGLKKLYAQGRRICQVEPYLEGVLLIQDLLAEGLSPQEIEKLPGLGEIYQREHEATGALLDFYAAMGASFEELIAKLKAFARADARRLETRDRLRAEALVRLLPLLPGPVFVEAGYIHLRLLNHLARFKEVVRLKVKNLLLEATRAHGLADFWPSPGDGLTSFYLLGGKHRKISEDLLAARSLVYIKLIEKEELVPTPQEPFPHLRHELIWRVFVSHLDYEQCKALDRVIRLLPTQKAQEKARKLFAREVQAAEERVNRAFSQRQA